MERRIEAVGLPSMPISPLPATLRWSLNSKVLWLSTRSRAAVGTAHDRSLPMGHKPMLGGHRRVRHALIEELGIEPGPELRLLERQVLEQSDQLAWQPVSRRSTGSVATPLPRASGVAGSQDPAINGTVLVTPRTGADVLPFVGRDTQLDRLAEMCSEAPLKKSETRLRHRQSRVRQEPSARRIQEWRDE